MRSRTLSLAIGLSSILAAQVALASDGDIRILFDPNQCSTTIPCGESRTLYVYAELAGATANGITGVEYSIRLGLDGAPESGWTFSEEFAPGAVAVGSGAFDPPDQLAIMPRFVRGRGINAAWPTCQTGSDGLVLIETVEVTNTGCTQDELQLLVWSHDTPRNGYFLCPLATLCDAPFYTKVCLGSNVTPCPSPEGANGPPAQCSTSGEAVINPVANSLSPCAPTAVEETTWSGVKRLYRD
jgi:hypothetical protein